MTPFLINGVLITDAIDIVQNNQNLVVTRADGSKRQFGFPSYDLALFNYTKIVGQVSGSNATSIYTISPNPFDFGPTSATNPITISGYGFQSGTIGSMFIEDLIGGQDSNGYQMACTYISSQTITAVFFAVNDAQLAANMMIYYQDSNGVKTAPIYGTVSGTVFTIS